MSVIVTTRPPSLVVMPRSSCTPVDDEARARSRSSACTGRCPCTATQALGRRDSTSGRWSDPIRSTRVERWETGRSWLPLSTARSRNQGLAAARVVGVAAVHLDLGAPAQGAEVIAEQRPGAVDREVADRRRRVDRRRVRTAARVGRACRRGGSQPRDQRPPKAERDVVEEEVVGLAAFGPPDRASPAAPPRTPRLGPGEVADSLVASCPVPGRRAAGRRDRRSAAEAAPAARCRTRRLSRRAGWLWRIANWLVLP